MENGQETPIPTAEESAASAKPEREPAQPGPGGWIWGTGRRKTSVARVRIREGTGVIVVNGKDYREFFPTRQAQLVVEQPLEVTGSRDKYDVRVNVRGGGITGQSGATSLGIARALAAAQPLLEPTLRDAGLLTRDSRMVERKKYGLRKARRAFQFSKR